MDKKIDSPTGKDTSRLVQALTAIQTFDREPNRVISYDSIYKIRSILTHIKLSRSFLNFNPDTRICGQVFYEEIFEARFEFGFEKCSSNRYEK